MFNQGSKMMVETLEPQYNEGPRDWQICSL